MRGRLRRNPQSAVPGLAERAPRYIRTAKFSSGLFDRLFVYHDFGDDQLRSEVLSALLPASRLETLRRRDVSHARNLVLALKDGRRVSILLDQGFGAWTCDAIRHDFSAAAPKQARELEERDFAVRISEPNGSPIVVEMST